MSSSTARALDPDPPTPPQDWTAEIRRLTRAAFAERYPHPFLIVLADAANDPGGFATAMVGVSDDGDSSGDYIVLPVTKSGANPYQDRVLVGRARNCDLVLRDAAISKLHADLRVSGPGEATLTDHGSRNGTLVNGFKLEAKRSVVLNSGDRVCFAQTTVLFLDPRELHERL